MMRGKTTEDKRRRREIGKKMVGCIVVTGAAMREAISEGELPEIPKNKFKPVIDFVHSHSESDVNLFSIHYFGLNVFQYAAANLPLEPFQTVLETPSSTRKKAPVLFRLIRKNSMQLRMLDYACQNKHTADILQFVLEVEARETSKKHKNNDLKICIQERAKNKSLDNGRALFLINSVEDSSPRVFFDKIKLLLENEADVTATSINQKNNFGGITAAEHLIGQDKKTLLTRTIVDSMSAGKQPALANDLRLLLIICEELKKDNLLRTKNHILFVLELISKVACSQNADDKTINYIAESYLSLIGAQDKTTDDVAGKKLTEITEWAIAQGRAAVVKRICHLHLARESRQLSPGAFQELILDTSKRIEIKPAELLSTIALQDLRFLDIEKLNYYLRVQKAAAVARSNSDPWSVNRYQQKMSVALMHLIEEYKKQPDSTDIEFIEKVKLFLNFGVNPAYQQEGQEKTLTELLVDSYPEIAYMIAKRFNKYASIARNGFALLKIADVCASKACSQRDKKEKQTLIEHALFFYGKAMDWTTENHNAVVQDHIIRAILKLEDTTENPQVTAILEKHLNEMAFREMLSLKSEFEAKSTFNWVGRVWAFTQLAKLADDNLYAKLAVADYCYAGKAPAHYLNQKALAKKMYAEVAALNTRQSWYAEWMLLQIQIADIPHNRETYFAHSRLIYNALLASFLLVCSKEFGTLQANQFIKECMQNSLLSTKLTYFATMLDSVTHGYESDRRKEIWDNAKLILDVADYSEMVNAINNTIISLEPLISSDALALLNAAINDCDHPANTHDADEGVNSKKEDEYEYSTNPTPTAPPSELMTDGDFVQTNNYSQLLASGFTLYPPATTPLPRDTTYDADDADDSEMKILNNSPPVLSAPLPFFQKPNTPPASGSSSHQTLVSGLK